MGCSMGRELVFGKLAPGETRRWTTTLGQCLTEKKTDKRVCRIPRNTVDRADGITIEFEEAHGHTPDPVEVTTLIRALPRPRFAYGLQVADNVRGNGDGLVQRGEQVTIYFTVKNVGQADTYDLQANIQNKSGHGVLLYDGRFQREKPLSRGDEWVVPFTVQVLPEFEQDEATLMLGVFDDELDVYAGQKLVIPVHSEEGPVDNLGGKQWVRVSAGTEVRGAPDPGASPIATLEKDAVFPLTARSGGLERVNLGGGRPGWVQGTSTAAAKGPTTKSPALAWVTPNAAPEIDLDDFEVFATRGATFRVRGRATDDQRVRDLYISTSGHKVFYESNQQSKTPQELSFDTEVPVRPGLNSIAIVARQDSGVVSRRYFIVRRDAKDGSLLETKKFEGALFGNGNGYH